MKTIIEADIEKIGKQNIGVWKFLPDPAQKQFSKFITGANRTNSSLTIEVILFII